MDTRSTPCLQPPRLLPLSHTTSFPETAAQGEDTHLPARARKDRRGAPRRARGRTGQGRGGGGRRGASKNIP